MESLRKWLDSVGKSKNDSDTLPVNDEVQPSNHSKNKKKKKLKKEDDSYSSSSGSMKKKKPTWKDYLLMDNRLRIVYVVILCIILGLILPSLISYFLGDYQADLGNCNPPTIYKLECMSGSVNAVNATSCENAGCCYDEKSTPKCFHKSPTRYTYVVKDVLEGEKENEQRTKIAVDLVPERRKTDYFGQSLPNARAVVSAVNPHHLVIQFLRPNQVEDNYRLLTKDEKTPLNETFFDVDVSIIKKKSFSITIRRPGTGSVLFDTSRGPLVINEHYVEMTTTVPSENVYGLGLERKSSFIRNFNYTKSALYNRATNGADGFHPFYMALEPVGGFAYGVFWDNPYPLEVQLSPAPSVSFRAMGGSGIFHIFSGPTPSDVSQQFARDIIGPAVMPPFWSLGLHLCRESNDPNVFDHTLTQMNNYDIGFDSDCIDRRLSGPGAGRIDTERFPKAQDNRQALVNLYKKFILAQPPHVLEQESFPQLEWIQNNASDVNEDGNVLMGSRYQTNISYPSYLDITEESGSMDLNWQDLYSPDGFDLVDNWPLDNRTTNCSTDRTRLFIPERLNGSITARTLCLDSWHPNLELEHLAVHNHYGIQQLNAFIQSGWPVRYLYLNRASALGNLGQAGYSGEESVSANWASMKSSLIQTLEMGLFGVPLSGAPICGTVNSTFVDNLPNLDDEQLCTRWYQMGLLFPYAHSTYNLNQRARSPIDWSLSARRYIATYIQQRYRLLSHYYTLFYQFITAGTPLVRPMFYHFPNDSRTYNLSEQFMVGDGIMVCPVMAQQLDENTVSVSPYFPIGAWYDFYNGDLLLETSNGTKTTVSTSLNHVNMYVRNATVFTTQDAGSSAEDTRKNTYTVTTAFPITTSAKGMLYVDDGVTSDATAYDLVQFEFTNKTFTMTRINNNFVSQDSISTVVNQIRIFGFDPKYGEPVSNAEFNPQTGVLVLKNLNVDWKVKDAYSVDFVR